MSVETDFKKAAYLIAKTPAGSVESSTEQKLKVYALYKQATVGDINIAQPWAVQLEARAKWDAWNALKGKSKEDAMREYVALLAAGDPNWKQHEVLKSYTE